MTIEEVARITGLTIGEVLEEVDGIRLKHKLRDERREDIHSYTVSLQEFIPWYEWLYNNYKKGKGRVHSPGEAVMRAYDLGYVQPYICHRCITPYED